jgi:hypothetical protein
MTYEGGTPVTGESGVIKSCAGRIKKVSIPRLIVCEIRRYTYNVCNVTDRIPEISSYTVISGIVKGLRAQLAVFPGKPLKLPDQLV